MAETGREFWGVYKDIFSFSVSLAWPLCMVIWRAKKTGTDCKPLKAVTVTMILLQSTGPNKSSQGHNSDRAGETASMSISWVWYSRER
jgi:hypothetical protein